jgi:tyrosine-protein kinase Etk/Wzc
MLVLHRAEELRIVKSGWIGNARVLEPAAVPHRPASPRSAPVLVLALLLGAGGGVLAATARRHLDPGVKHPEEIEAGTGLPVFATIHRSPAQRALSRKGREGPRPTLATADPADPAVEELRALRSSVQFSLARAQSNVVAVSGLAPLAGKSFVSANLAQLLASGEGRVLLVDADLRRGALHRHLGVDASPGLAEVASGAAELDAAIRRTDVPSLDLLPAGAPAGTPAELLAGEPFARLVAEAGRRYRAVVIDTPPVLSVNDAALIARTAGVTLLVVRAGQHSIQEIDWAVRRLAQSGVRVRGAVLNDVRAAGTFDGRVRRYRYGPLPA